MRANPESLALLLTYYFEKSKMFAYWSIGISLFISLVGIVGVFFPRWKDRLATLIIGLTIAVAGLSWMSEGTRSTAEALKRHQEFVDGLGVPVSVRLLTDAYVDVDNNALRRIATPLLPGTEFASPDRTGPSRLLEDMAESAWFSAKISRTCAGLTLGTFIGGIVLAILWMHGTLSYITSSVTKAADLKKFSLYGSLTGGLVLFLLSTGVLQTSLGYFAFATQNVPDFVGIFRSRKHHVRRRDTGKSGC